MKNILASLSRCVLLAAGALTLCSVDGFAQTAKIEGRVIDAQISGNSGVAEIATEGVLVMAHGGGDEWDQAVREAVVPLGSYCPVAIAFGMADRDSLQKAVSSLEEKGVNRIAVVRLFVSPESFKHSTEYFLGLRADQPRHYMHHSGTMANGDDHGTPMPIQRKAAFILNQHGLFEASGMGDILAERVKALSELPKDESVLILAHGTGSDKENTRWLTSMNERANKVREIGAFRDVRVETLREDWEGKRKIAEQRIHDFVEQANRDGGRAIVVPFRVFGFGPYRKVLDGLEYIADGRGLLPHLRVTEWLEEEAADCFSRADWANPFAR